MAENKGPRGSTRKPRRTHPETIDLTATPVEEGSGRMSDQAADEAAVGTYPVENPVPEAEVYGPYRPGEEPAARAPAGSEAPLDETRVTADAEAAEEAAAQERVAREEIGEDAYAGNGSEPRAGLGAMFAAGVVGAALTLTGLVALATAEWLPLPGGHDPALANRLTALERQFAERPAGAPAAATDPRVEDALGQIEAERQRIAANSSAIEELRGQIGTAPAADPEAPARNADFDRRLAELSQALDALKGEVASSSASEQIQALDGRIASTEQRLEAVGQVETEVKALGETVSAARAQAESASQRAAEAAAIALLDSTAARGVPFGAALDRVKAIVPDQKVVALEAGAQNGLVSIREAGDRLARDLSAAPAPGPGAEANLVDRFLIGARDLVSIRQVDGPAVNTPSGSERARVHELLESGDYRAALEEWGKLDEAAREATKQSADALRQRLDAEDELQSLRQRALAASAETNEGAKP